MIKKIDHIGIAVKGIEETLAFYKTLGLRLAHTEAESEQRVEWLSCPLGRARRN